MTELLMYASDALIANDASTLERLAQEASGYAAMPGSGHAIRTSAGLGIAVEVLRRQVAAASIQLATRRRFNAALSLQANAWAR